MMKSFTAVSTAILWFALSAKCVEAAVYSSQATYTFENGAKLLYRMNSVNEGTVSFVSASGIETPINSAATGFQIYTISVNFEGAPLHPSFGVSEWPWNSGDSLSGHLVPVIISNFVSFIDSEGRVFETTIPREAMRWLKLRGIPGIRSAGDVFHVVSLEIPNQGGLGRTFVMRASDRAVLLVDYSFHSTPPYMGNAMLYFPSTDRRVDLATFTVTQANANPSAEPVTTLRTCKQVLKNETPSENNSVVPFPRR